MALDEAGETGPETGGHLTKPGMTLAKPMRLARDLGAVLRARWYLRHADEVGTRVRIWGRPVIKNYGKLIVGDRSTLVSTIATLEIVSGERGTIDIGDRVFINYGGSIAASELIRIGSRCHIGTHAILMDNDFHSVDPARRGERPPSKPIVLEENVWLGALVIVLRGVTIGKGSVIGAGSVVTRDIPAYCVAAGQPARVIRRLGA